MTWAEFWNRKNSIYVNERHLQAHYNQLLAGLLPHLPRPPFTLLDYGCGEALIAPMLAERGGRVILYDVAENQRAAVAKRYAHIGAISVVAERELAALPAQSFDAVIMISVLQYMSDHELGRVLDRLRPLLAGGGRLILADIIPPDGCVCRDVMALLRFAAANGFLIAALIGLIKTLGSDYRRLRRSIGLTTYDPSRLGTLVERHGWRLNVLPHNIGFDANRWSAVVEPV